MLLNGLSTRYLAFLHVSHGLRQGSDIKEFQKLAEAALQNKDTPPERAFFIEVSLSALSRQVTEVGV